MTTVGGRHALIVAVSDYRDPKLRKLRAPAADAAELARVLKDPDIGDFEVSIAAEEDEGTLRRRIATFFGNRQPDDLLLIHFSCHGVKDATGELYLAARDTELGDLLGATGIASRWLNEQIARCRSKRIVVLLDCCFSGSFPFGMRSRADQHVHLPSYLEGRGRAVITASSAMEYAYEGDDLSGKGQPSIFTRTVVEGLRTGMADLDGDKWVSVDELYEYVFDRVKELTPDQTPNKMSTLEGSLHIARSTYEPPVVPAELNAELITLTSHPLADARAGAVVTLARLVLSDSKPTALAARQRLELMTDDDSRSVARAAEDALDAAEGALDVSPPPPPPPPWRPSTRPDPAPARYLRYVRPLTIWSSGVFVASFIAAIATPEKSSGQEISVVIVLFALLGLLTAMVLAIVGKLERNRRSRSKTYPDGHAGRDDRL